MTSRTSACFRDRHVCLSHERSWRVCWQMRIKSSLYFIVVLLTLSNSFRRTVIFREFATAWIIICSLPYYSCSSAKSIHSYIVRCFLYTAQGDAEGVELQESIYKNDTRGYYLAGEIPHWKNSFHLPIHWLEFYQVQIIWIPIMKLNWLVWHMEHSCSSN